jgi:hypothetical protein
MLVYQRAARAFAPHPRLFAKRQPHLERGDDVLRYPALKLEHVDGIAEDVLTTLSKIQELLVIDRNSSFVFKGQARDIREIGRMLGARDSACFQSAETSNANGCRFRSLLRHPGPLAYFSRAIQG